MRSVDLSDDLTELVMEMAGSKGNIDTPASAPIYARA